LRNIYKILVEIAEKRPLSRTRHIWEDDIKIDLRYIRCEDVDWINLAQDRVQ
jgi:hypothetical protein